MGSWNGTCMVSNLPILYNEKVKLIFLHSNENRLKNIINESAIYDTFDILSPSFLQLEGEYNSYGGIENINNDKNYHIINDFFKSKWKSIKNDSKELTDFNIEDVIELMHNNFSIYSEGFIKDKKYNELLLSHYFEDNKNDIKYLYELASNIDISEKWRPSNITYVLIRLDVWNSIINNHKYKCYDYNLHSNNNLDDFYNPNIYENILIDDTELKNQYNELIIINDFLKSIRKSWMIQCGNGSSSENWNNYKLLSDIIYNISDKKINNT